MALRRCRHHGKGSGTSAGSPVVRDLHALRTGPVSLDDLRHAVLAEDLPAAESALDGTATADRCAWEGRVGDDSATTRILHPADGVYHGRHGMPAVLRDLVRDITQRRQVGWGGIGGDARLARYSKP